MFKKSKNPKVEEITRTWRERIYAIGNIPHLKNEAGQSTCCWCGDPLKSRHPNARYCKDDNCSKSMWAWGNPQGDQGKAYLLEAQDYKCKICQYDWSQHKSSIWVGHSAKKRGLIPEDRRPEVDHIIPISKGGTALGLDNHQCICYTCHKAKSKIDNSGPRVKDPVKARKRMLKRHSIEMSKRFYEYYVKQVSPTEKNRDLYEKFWVEIATVEEIDMEIEHYDLNYGHSSYQDHKDRLRSFKQAKLDKISKVSDTDSE